MYTDTDRQAALQIGSLQQRHAEVATAVEQLSQETNAAQQALIQALQAEGTAAVCTTPTCLTHRL